MGCPFTSWYNTEDQTMSDRNVGDRFISLSSTQRKVVSHWLASFLASRLLSSPPFRAFRTVAGWTVIFGWRFAIALTAPRRASYGAVDGLPRMNANCHSAPGGVQSRRAMRSYSSWYLWRFLSASTICRALRIMSFFRSAIASPQDGPWIDHLLLLEIQRALRRDLQCGQGNEALRRLGHHVNCIQGVVPGIPRTVPRNPLVHELLQKRRLPRGNQNTPSLEHGGQHLLEPAALRPRQSRVRGNGNDGHEDRRLCQQFVELLPLPNALNADLLQRRERRGSCNNPLIRFSLGHLLGVAVNQNQVSPRGQSAPADGVVVPFLLLHSVRGRGIVIAHEDGPVLFDVLVVEVSQPLLLEVVALGRFQIQHVHAGEFNGPAGGLPVGNFLFGEHLGPDRLLPAQ